MSAFAISETVELMQRAGELTEIKTFTGKKTLMNAVALVLHSLWLELEVYKRVCYSVARSDRSSDLEDEKNPKDSSNKLLTNFLLGSKIGDY